MYVSTFRKLYDIIYYTKYGAMQQPNTELEGILDMNNRKAQRIPMCTKYSYVNKLQSSRNLHCRASLNGFSGSSLDPWPAPFTIKIPFVVDD